jgi:AraC-like DNA-binding protein
MKTVQDNYPKAYLYMRIVQAKLFIDKHYSQSIKLDNIIGEAFFSKYHFIRVFTKIYGYTPYQYLKSLRIKKAQQLLMEGGEISDVAYSVGFESVTTFFNLFKKEVGYTPAVYRHLYVKRKDEINNAPLSFIPGCYAEKMDRS